MKTIGKFYADWVGRLTDPPKFAGKFYQDLEELAAYYRTLQKEIPQTEEQTNDTPKNS